MKWLLKLYWENESTLKGLIDAKHLLCDNAQTCNIVKKESGSLILDEKPLGCHTDT